MTPMHGDGRVFRPKRKAGALGVWYYSISFGGRVKIGRGYSTREAALTALKEERKRKKRGEFIPPERGRLTVAHLLDAYLKDLKDRGKKSLASVKCRIELLKESLGFQRAMDLSTDHVETYRRQRLAFGRDKATVDREVQILRAAFRLALKREWVARIPYFPMFNVDHVRQGFFEQEEAQKIEAQLPEVLAEVVRFASLSGWRIGEILPLRWEQVDLKAREIRLGTTKNGRPRTLTLRGSLWDLILRRSKAREYRMRKKDSALSAYVFHRRGGRPVSYSNYRREFASACKRAGVEGRTTHDFRRTVARDLRRAGVPETVCMTITGHESPQVFRRYAGIIDPKEQEAAFAAREALLQSEREKESNVARLSVR
jgi:integrase